MFYTDSSKLLVENITRIELKLADAGFDATHRHFIDGRRYERLDMLARDAGDFDTRRAAYRLCASPRRDLRYFRQIGFSARGVY